MITIALVLVVIALFIIDDAEHVHGDSYCPTCFRRQCYYCEHCEENQFNDDPCSCEDERYPDEDTGLLSDQTEVELQYSWCRYYINSS
jgi:hypothetical protein